MQTAEPAILTPEHIAMTTTLNLSEAYAYWHILERIAAIDSLDRAEMQEIHRMIYESAMTLGLKATTYIPVLGYIQVASPIAVARAMLSIARHERKLLGGGA